MDGVQSDLWGRKVAFSGMAKLMGTSFVKNTIDDYSFRCISDVAKLAVTSFIKTQRWFESIHLPRLVSSSGLGRVISAGACSRQFNLGRGVVGRYFCLKSLPAFVPAL